MKLLTQLTVVMAAILFVACAKKDDSGSSKRNAGPAAADKPAPTIPPLRGPIKNNRESEDKTIATDKNKTKRPKKDLSKDFSTSEAMRIRQQLEQKFDGIQDEKQKERNIKLAESITDVRLHVYDDSGIADVVIEMKDQKGKAQRLDLAGKMTEKNQAQLAASLSTLRHQYHANLQCMDQKSTECRVSILTLHSKIKNEKSEAKILVRHSNADIDFEAPHQSLRNGSAKKLTEMLQNEMDLKRDRTDSFRTTLIDSFEVIRGRSYVSIMMIGRNNEVLAFRAPMLLVDSRTNFTNVKMEREVDETVLTLFGNLGEFKYSLQNDLQDVRLVELVGNERFGLLLRFGDDEDSEELSLNLYRQRIATQLLK